MTEPIYNKGNAFVEQYEMVQMGGEIHNQSVSHTESKAYTRTATAFEDIKRYAGQFRDAIRLLFGESVEATELYIKISERSAFQNDCSGVNALPGGVSQTKHLIDHVKEQIRMIKDPTVRSQYYQSAQKTKDGVPEIYNNYIKKLRDFLGRSDGASREDLKSGKEKIYKEYCSELYGAVRNVADPVIKAVKEQSVIGEKIKTQAFAPKH